MTLIMSCIYAVSPKSSKNPEIIFYAQFGQGGRAGAATKDGAVGKPKPRKAGPGSRTGGGAGLGSGAGAPHLGLSCPSASPGHAGPCFDFVRRLPTKDGLPPPKHGPGWGRAAGQRPLSALYKARPV